MLCSRCNKDQAAVFYKQLVDNKVSEHHLCLKCAQEAPPEGAAGAAVSPVLNLLELLGAQPRRAPRGRKQPVRCPACGMKYREFQEGGRLGCSTCYETFAPLLKSVLARYHGAERHKGKAPVMSKGASEYLKKALETAIAREDFEEAARIRDRLKRFEDRGG